MTTCRSMTAAGGGADLAPVTLRELIYDLIINPKLVAIQRAGGQVLISDPYVLWDLSKVRVDVEGAHLAVSHLPGLPRDGVYTWHRTRPPELLDRKTMTDLSAIWAMFTRAGGKPLYEITWSPWSYQDERIGTLRGQPVAVNRDWLSRLTQRLPGHQLAGRHPAQPVMVLDDRMPRQAVGVVATPLIPPPSDAASRTLAEVIDHGIGWDGRHPLTKGMADAAYPLSARP